MGFLALFVVARHCHSHTADAPAASLQSAVTSDGFLIAHGAACSWRVATIDTHGNRTDDIALDRSGDVRVVGTTAGAAAAWQDGKRIKLASVGTGKELGSWGKAVQHLCDGVASNDARFAVGWLEADQTVWIVHGPTSRQALAAAVAPKTDWCGVASAEDNVAMLWRENDRLLLTMCNEKGCSSLVAGFGLERKLPVIGFGCVEDSCLVAARDAAGAARLALVTTRAKTQWTKPLERAKSAISIVGVGNRSFAAAYATRDGAEVVRVARDGTMTSVWRGAVATAPVVSWSSGRLLVAYMRDHELLHDVIPLD
jgi:hypothetical protein